MLFIAPDQSDDVRIEAILRLLLQLQSSNDVILLFMNRTTFDPRFKELTSCAGIPNRHLGLLVDKDEKIASNFISEILDQHQPTVALSCSLNATNLTKELASRFIPVITLTLDDVESFRETVRIPLYMYSTAVVFPDQQIKINHLENYPWLASRRLVLAPILSSEEADITCAMINLSSLIEDCEDILAELKDKYHSILNNHLNNELECLHIFKPDEFINRLAVNCYVGGVATGRPPAFPLPRLLVGFDGRRFTATTGNNMGNPAIECILYSCPENFFKPVIKIDKSINVSCNYRAALHGHYYYTDVAIELFQALAVNNSKLDLYLSTDSDAKANELSCLAKAYNKPAEIRVFPNRGRDLGPLLTGYRDIFDAGYDVIGHVHGKKSPHISSEVSARWRQNLMEHTVGGNFSMADSILAAFCSNKRLGLVFPEYDQCHGWDGTLDVANYLATRMKISQKIDYATFDFPAGSFFWCRPEAMQPLLSLGLDWEDYPEEPIPTDYTILHAIERLFPFVCEDSNYDYITTYIPPQSKQ